MCKPKVNAFKVAGPGGAGMERDSEEKNKETIVLFLLVLAFITFFINHITCNNLPSSLSHRVYCTREGEGG